RQRFLKNTSRIKTGDILDPDRLRLHLVEIGYRAVPAVEDLGEFSLHGGILDIFSTGQEMPVRIELFGDTVESIRSFDPATQRSDEKVEQVLILPSDLETFFDEKTSGGASFFDYLPAGTLAVLDEPTQLSKTKIKPDSGDSSRAV